MNKMKISTEIDNIKRYEKGIPELEITITEMKNPLEEFKSRLQ